MFAWIRKAGLWLGYLMRAVRIIKTIALAIEDNPDIPEGARDIVKKAIAKAARAEGLEGVLNKVIKSITEGR